MMQFCGSYLPNILQNIDAFYWKDPDGKLPTDFIEYCLLPDPAKDSPDAICLALEKGLIPRGQMRDILKMAAEDGYYQRIPSLLAYLDLSEAG